MAKAQRDVVEMDIEEVMGLIAPQKKPAVPSQAAVPASLHSPSDSTRRNQQTPTGGAPPSHRGEGSVPFAGPGGTSTQSYSETGTKEMQSNAMEEDDLYDPLAGDESPSPSVKQELFEQAKQLGAASEGLSVSKGTSDDGTLQKVVPLPGVKESAEQASEASQSGKDHLGAMQRARNPPKAAPLAGLLEQYDDEESEGEEEGGVSIEEGGRGPTVERGDAKRGTKSMELKEALQFVSEVREPPLDDMQEAGVESREGGEEAAEERMETQADMRGGKERAERGGLERDENLDSGRQRDGGEASTRHSEHGERYGPKDRGGGQDRRRDNWRGSERSRHPDDPRSERDPPRDVRFSEPRGHRQSRGHFERAEDNARGGRFGGERDRGDRRRDDASFRGGNKDMRDRGRESEFRNGPRTERRGEGRDREPPSRHSDSRHRMRPRSPAIDDRREKPPAGPSHKPPRKADSRPDSKPAAKADQKHGPAAKEGSTGADVDLSAAVAAAAAAAAKSAKLAASRAPPPPADPAEAAAKAAEMVNKTLMIQNAVLQQKRKMLWGDKAATTEEAATGGTNRWDAVAVGDTERTHKFQKLMGLKGAAPLSPPKTGEVPAVVPAVMTAEKQQQVQAELERQYAAGLRRRDGRTVGLGL
ncbi:hypothetical protein KFL_001510290 [Klebsormidium nitens]|uniref:Small acidic protein-like domain-containing protein n=1 Tax=Klebsormidium nitens TaxID=105231 RepID=A0A1Y1I452_KLENI|nr:hypothetical protein KFL_001510290 [Klebsormidium nitens]|eukprot:GAQ83527.1 hypothetical protein KFL_001510290 [Klebsormidium nitens]